MVSVQVSFVLSLLLSFAAAAPLVPRKNTAPVTHLTSAQISAITPFAEFARAAYCSHAAVQAWSCGAACSALPGVHTLLTGGDNNLTPDYYVAYYPSTKAIVVAHQGTDIDNILSDLDDADAILVGIDQSYFPGTSGLEVHQGFQATFERAAKPILAAVQSGLKTYPGSQVYVVGHSLGAAVGLLDALYLRLQLPSSTSITTTLFGLPRVGNQAFANYIDSHALSLQHVVNDNDVIPRLPSTDFGYEHPSGEVFIESNGVTYDACPGQENYNCAIGINFLFTTESKHDGPYAGVMLGSSYCTA